VSALSATWIAQTFRTLKGGRRDPDLLTLLSYGRLAKVYLDVLVDGELDLPEDASPCGPL
jgi:hypothetical protein